MTRTDQSPAERPSPWLIVPLACLVILMVFTVSDVGERRAEQGTVGILPTAVLEISKVGARGLVIALMLVSLPFICQHARFQPAIGLMAPWLLFGAWCVASTLWSPVKQMSLFQAGSLAAVLLVATITGILINGQRDVSRLFSTVVHALMAICAGLLVLHVTMPQVGAVSRWSLGLFHSTNSGCAAGLGLVTLLAAHLIGRWDWTGRILIPGILVFVAVLLVANNRLSMTLATLLSLAIWIVFGNRVLLAATTLAATLVVVAYLAFDPGLHLVTAATGSAGEYVLQGQTEEELSSFSGRAEMWQAIWKSFWQSPWIGHGYFTTSASGELFVWHRWHNWTAHNMLLQLAASTGLIGIALFLGSVVWTAAILARRYLHVPHLRPTILVCATVGSWWLGWGILNESIFGPLEPETVVFGSLLAVATSVATVPVPARRGKPVTIGSPLRSAPA